jgi:hypothetical protein
LRWFLKFNKHLQSILEKNLKNDKIRVFFQGGDENNEEIFKNKKLFVECSMLTLGEQHLNHTIIISKNMK